jgi:hypothetical protein
MKLGDSFVAGLLSMLIFKLFRLRPAKKIKAGMEKSEHKTNLKPACYFLPTGKIDK